MPTALRIIAIVIATVIEVFFLLWFLLPIRYRIFKAGNMLGVLICLIALFRTAFCAVYRQLDAYMLQNTFTKIVWLIIKYGCVLFVIYAIVVSICMIIAMKRKPKKNATAVILGAQVKPWGASRLLKQRIKAAETYLDQNPDVKAIASGGQGANEPMSEAACIYENMIKDGVDPERILIEDQSVNTEQNLLYSVKLIKERHLGDDIAIVSDSYHQLRARIIAYKIDRNLHVGAINTVNTRFGWFIYPSFFLREWIAIPVEIVKKLGRPARHRKI